MNDYKTKVTAAAQSEISDAYRQVVANHQRKATQAVQDVLAERERQITVENWTPEVDDRYVAGDMAFAAACYATQGQYHFPEVGKPGPGWPWAAEWWKPSNYRRNLIKAAALIIAEIDRIDRAELKNKI